jgi:hypothetical protein
MFSLIKSFMPTTVKKWIKIKDDEPQISEKVETESYTFNLSNKSKIRSIHYISNDVHFSSSDYKLFIES